jgi:hypothetical protein
MCAISVPLLQSSIPDNFDPWERSDDESTDDLKADDSATVSYTSDSTEEIGREDSISESDCAFETSEIATMSEGIEII